MSKRTRVHAPITPRPRSRRTPAVQPIDHDLEVHKLEAVEFYAASTQAWYGTSMEFDRSLVTLSAAAIGLLIGLATTGFADLHGWSRAGFTAAIISFALALAAMLAVFKLNRKYLEEMVRLRDGARASHRVLKCLDWGALICFGVGAVLAVAIAIAAVFAPPRPKEDVVTQKPSSTTKTVGTFDSVDGAKSMSSDFGKSFNSATSMRPIASQRAKPSTAPAAAPVASAAKKP